MLLMSKDIIFNIYVILQTGGHIHCDIRLKGPGGFPVFGDEIDPEETGGRAVESRHTVRSLDSDS